MKLGILSRPSLFLLFGLHLHVNAQLSIPSSPFQPASTSSGAIRSNSTSIPNPQWSNLLGDLLWFYDVQRSGNLSVYNRISWRNNSVLNDNPQGGFYDAGSESRMPHPMDFISSSKTSINLDYLKATFPLVGRSSALSTQVRNLFIRPGL